MATAKLKYWKIDVAQTLISAAWQYHLGTTLDPADGRWFLRGPGNNDVGLYGGLEDTLDGELKFDTTKPNLTSKKVLGVSNDVKNLNGLNPGPVNTKAVLSYQKGYETTHSESSSLQVGVSMTVSAEATVDIIKVGMSTTYSFSYTHNWEKSVSEMSQTTKGGEVEVPVSAPAGTVYKARVMADNETLIMPYRAWIILSGTTEANFKLLVNGKKKHTATAGELCNWIRQYGLVEGGVSGDKTISYGAHPNDPSKGVLEMRGEIKVADAYNFMTDVINVTNGYNSENPVIVKKF